MLIKENDSERTAGKFVSDGLPEYIRDYKIEREFGTRAIEDCVKEIVLLHIAE